MLANNSLSSILYVRFPWLEKNIFLTRILQDFLLRPCKLMQFSSRHLASILQGDIFNCKILSRRKISLKDSCKEHICSQDSSKEKNFLANMSADNVTFEFHKYLPNLTKLQLFLSREQLHCGIPCQKLLIKFRKVRLCHC